MDKYNDDKPHRCPQCHTITVDLYHTPLDRLSERFRHWTSGSRWHVVREQGMRLSWRFPTARQHLTLASVTCCRCGTEFTRWPTLPVLVRRGVICPEHRA